MSRNFDPEGWPYRYSEPDTPPPQKPNRLAWLGAAVLASGAIGGGAAVAHEVKAHPDKAPRALLAGASVTAVLIVSALARRNKSG